MLGFIRRRDFLIPHDGIQKLIDDHIPFRNLQDAKLPLHIVATDIISGESVVLSEGSTAQAIVASTAIPGAFAPVRYKDFYLADGAISSNTPIKVAVSKGANRLIVLPTGYACSTQDPPVGAVANALHALTLLIARQMVSELEDLGADIEYFVVPPLCPLVGSPYDFSRTADHIERAIKNTDAWLAQGGLERRSIPARDAPARPLRRSGFFRATLHCKNHIAGDMPGCIDSPSLNSVASKTAGCHIPDLYAPYRVQLIRIVGLGCGRRERTDKK